MLTVAAVVDLLDRLAPPSLAAEWDNVGLLLGERAAAADRIMTCLTVTPESAAEAVAEKANLIVTHHPILFRSVKRLTDATPEGRTLLSLARAGVTVYSPHTAYDNAHGGINDRLCERIGLVDVGPLRRRDASRRCKVVVFTPEADLRRVADAMFAAGAGRIGAYSECSFRLAGTGTFLGGEESNPTVGTKGRREEVAEARLEVVCEERDVGAVTAALRRAHSYEEPAYDVYPLRPSMSPSGEGRLGQLTPPRPLADFAQSVKAAVDGGPVQLVGALDRPVKGVAVACGAGAELLADAARAGADAFVTGEARFHDLLAARAQGLALVLPGHYATERFAVEELAGWIGDELPAAHVWASRRESDPSAWV
jgi:dinuclear metal center YbgI/SA1388 family protein